MELEWFQRWTLVARQYLHLELVRFQCWALDVLQYLDLELQWDKIHAGQQICFKRSFDNFSGTSSYIYIEVEATLNSLFKILSIK